MKKLVIKFAKKILGDNFFYNNISQIKRATAGSQTYLDLGCGSNSPYLKYLHNSGHFVVGVDLYANPSGYNEIIRRDVMDFVQNVPDDAYDAVLAFDIIEHLSKEDATLLILEMERVARNCVAIVTPNGFWPGMIDGPGMRHICGFNAEEFSDLGYSLYGSGGLAVLRSRKHSFLKGFPYAWMLPIQVVIFNFSQLISKGRPRLAYGLTAIKSFRQLEP